MDVKVECFHKMAQGHDVSLVFVVSCFSI